jgi:sugar phosphate isomerase/epimerase
MAATWCSTFDECRNEQSCCDAANEIGKRKDEKAPRRHPIQLDPILHQRIVFCTATGIGYPVENVEIAESREDDQAERPGARMDVSKSMCRGFLAALITMCCAADVVFPADQNVPRNSFFAYCHDTHDTKKRSLVEQASLLEELGYDGLGHLWLDNIAERLETLDRHGLKLFQVYVRVSIDPNKPKYDPRLPEVIKQLKGRDVILGMLITGRPPSDEGGDERAVQIAREVADMAAASDLRIAFYPHTNDWMERVEDGIRLARKVERENVGVMFNLCHWMKAQQGKNLKPLLQAALPHLFVVTINGSDYEGNWDRLIQPLDAGEFDVYGLLKTLQELDYQGPVGLMCYGMQVDVRDPLTRSMKAWREFERRLAAEKRSVR